MDLALPLDLATVGLDSLAAVLQQQPPDVQPEPGAGSLVGGGIGAFLSTLLVGGILVALVPDYVRGRMADLRESPLKSFLYGFVALVLLAILIVVLAITLIGIPIAFLVGVVAWVLWAIGSAIGYLTIANRFVGDGSLWVPLLVAAAINGVLTLTGIGGIVSFLVGAAGFGAVLVSLLR